MSKVIENSEADEEEELNEETRQNLMIRLVFNREITDDIVKEVAGHLGRLIRDNEIKAKAILWEGINIPQSFQFKDSIAIATHFYAHKWLNTLVRKRNKSLENFPTRKSLLQKLPSQYQVKIPG